MWNAVKVDIKGTCRKTLLLRMWCEVEARVWRYGNGRIEGKDELRYLYICSLKHGWP